LVVEDHGEGRRGAPLAGGSGYGLTGMRERAELLGGTLVVGKTADGFRVELWTPS
jgi:signal transduction histidine kinase